MKSNCVHFLCSPLLDSPELHRTPLFPFLTLINFLYYIPQRGAFVSIWCLFKPILNVLLLSVVWVGSSRPSEQQGWAWRCHFKEENKPVVYSVVKKKLDWLWIQSCHSDGIWLIKSRESEDSHLLEVQDDVSISTVLSHMGTLRPAGHINHHQKINHQQKLNINHPDH